MNHKLYKTSQGPGQAADAANPDAPLCFPVPSDGKARRLDVFLGDALREDGFSREKIKQAIRAGQVCRNDIPCLKANTALAAGDAITIFLPPAPSELRAEEGELTVLWHDEHLAVLNKPAGLTVHPAPGRPEGTLAHRLVHYFPEVTAMGGLRPGIVHRLDKDTSGLMLVALTEKARLAMSEAFAERTVHKTYLALVHGVPRTPEAIIIKPIGRHPAVKTKMAVVPLTAGGKEARSDYTVMHADPGGRFSLLRVTIHTGRTHQIRVHMQDAGHPLIGDAVYGLPGRPAGAAALAPRQMLHAWHLSFIHPVTGAELSFRADPPPDFCHAAAQLATPMQRVVITGSPGGGKSALARALDAGGAPVWSADAAVARLYEVGGDGWYVLRRRYGERFTPDERKGVDKKALFTAMSASADLRREVEALIHPLARNELAAFWQAREAAGDALAVAEVPLYLEAGWRGGEQGKKSPSLNGEKHLLVAVYCPFALRRERMAKNRAWNDDTITAMESWQWPEDKKIRAADLVIDNTGILADLERHAAALFRVLAFLRNQAEQRAAHRFATLWQGTSGEAPPFRRGRASQPSPPRGATPAKGATPARG